MARRIIRFLFLFLLGSSCALYKGWVPDTNFENATNWDKGSVPCGNDQVIFPAYGKVSVYVQETHAIFGLSLPVDGEFILHSEAGFAITEGRDPGCGSGSTIQFRDSDSLKWFNPDRWKGASTLDDLQRGSYLFFVHEECVPCQYDDVVFREASSFRVDLSSNQGSIPVKSVSVFGKKFSSNSDFSQYANSHLGQLQFHGLSSLSVGGTGCSDITGCECGNSGNHNLICANINCSYMECKKPLLPTGHCCDVCGAIMTIHFTSSFNLESYRQRLQHLFLSLSKYKSIHMALSKVSTTQKILGVISYATYAEIQVVLLEDVSGPQSGKLAETLAWDILADINAQGSNLGIDRAEFHASNGASSNGGSGIGAGEITGAVLGILALVVFLALIVVLYRRGTLRMPSLPSLSSWKKDSEIGELGGSIDHGFENPIFDKSNALPGLYGSESVSGITLTHSGVHFANPVYDETDCTA